MMKYPFPKVDLHLHLDGSVVAGTAWSLAKERGIQLPAATLEDFRSFIILTADCHDVNEYLKRFEIPLSLLQDAAALERVTYELISLESYRGLCYIEIRFAPQLHTEKGLSQREAVDAVLAGRNRALKENPGIDAGIILCTMSLVSAHTNDEANRETVRIAKEYLDKGVVAVDLAGAEGIVPLMEYKYVFDLAKELGIPFTCHAGDSQGPDTVRDAMDFGAKRIGHGHHIFEDKALCARAIRDGITLEICPTSNIQCTTRPSYQEHPLKKLMDMGIACTVNTDNMVLSDINLDKEYDHCIFDMGLTYNDLIRLNINSVRAAFMPEEKKLPLIEKLITFLREDA